MEDKNSNVKNLLLMATSVIEDEVDQQLDRLDNLKSDDLEEIREKRLQVLKRQSKLRDEFMAKGHGQYSESFDRTDFFRTCRESDKVVAHFYRNETPRCAIFDRHLTILAQKHLETKFCKIQAENFVFLAERLNLWTIPSLILIKDSVICGFVIGFSDLGNCDDFTTDMLEWRLASSQLIDYNGDLTKPPTKTKRTNNNLLMKMKNRKTVRRSDDWTDDDEDLSDLSDDKLENDL